MAPIAKMMFGSHSTRALVMLGLLQELGLACLLTLSQLDRGSPALEIWFVLPFAIYAYAVRHVYRQDPRVAPPSTGIIILFFALIFHGTIFLSSSPLSNDIYRYYWDGKSVSHGFNPYQYSPDDRALQPWRDAYWDQVMNRDVHTMYPPLAQLVFATAFALSPGIASLRLASIAFNLLAIGALLAVLRELNLNPGYAIVYAWSPLAVVEFANSGHIDSLAVALMLLSVLALLRRRPCLSAGAMALAVLGKIFPLLFAGLFLPRWGKRGALVFAATVAIAYLPWANAGAGLVQGSSYFVDRGLFNGSLFPLLGGALEHLYLHPLSWRLAKLVILLGYAALYLILFLRARRERDDLHLAKYAFYLTGTFLLITPTMHPWYLTWILPWLCLFPAASWIVLSGTVILARTAYLGYGTTGYVREIPWATFVEYVPFYILWVRDPIRGIRRWIDSGTLQPPPTHDVRSTAEN